MSASARGIPATDNGAAQATRSELESRPRADAAVAQGAKLTVFVAADNRLLREALGRMLAKKGEIEVCGMESHGPLQAEQVAQANANVLLMTSRGALNDDLQMIQEVRAAAPGVRADRRWPGCACRIELARFELFLRGGIGGSARGARRRGSLSGRAMRGAISVF